MSQGMDGNRSAACFGSVREMDGGIKRGGVTFLRLQRWKRKKQLFKE